ncbi:MotA/TolQ/ExbB proton channel family protein [Hoeflea olei]|uniref:Flagellar motor protein MotA n=1 Tax=Hoeflea olei TaxID=1480615 RepID=A0A1C1YTU3_9HYPH|nr:MotA/TolQ/ExbB proton channel family protein [Hoeflea olei]OCW56959.1 flagellar motor protein MotA [Hoeflea olei]
MPIPDSFVSRLGSLLDLGGPVVAILMVGSVLSLAVIMVKVFQFTRGGVGSRGRSEQAVRLFAEGRAREAYELAARGRNPAAEAVAQAISLVSARRLDKPAIEEQVARLATERLHDLQSGLRFLDAVAQLAPLLGLFGTVLGMIDAFKELQSAGNAVDPSVLAGGIWVALLTTAAGLAVAMPVSMILTWFETRIEHERIAIQTLTTDILSGSAPHTPSARDQALSGEALLAH